MKHLKKKTVRRAGWAIGCLAAILVYIAACAVSWVVTCGVIKLITLCFGWTFSIGVATGMWLIIYLARTIFKSDVIVEK